MDMNNDALLGYCGLYCGNCIYYQNTVKGVGTDRGDGVYEYCEGCNSGNATTWCTDCAIKKCGIEKSKRYCLECGEFPCGKMKDFMYDPKYKYHLDVTENMRKLKIMGLDAWCDAMDSKYICKSCGEKFNYMDEKCQKCLNSD